MHAAILQKKAIKLVQKVAFENNCSIKLQAESLVKVLGKKPIRKFKFCNAAGQQTVTLLNI